MKKAIIFLAALILLSFVTNAQKAFDQSSRIFGIGVGLGANYYNYGKGYGWHYRRTPTICLNYEQAYKERVGPGFIGIGGLFTYQSAVLKYNEAVWLNEKYYYQHSYRNFVLAARVSYHWDELVTDKAELYGGVVAGLRIQTYRFSTDYPDADYYRFNNGSRVLPVAGLYLGGRYYFTPKVAGYLELSGGAGIPYITVGLNFKI